MAIRQTAFAEALSEQSTTQPFGGSPLSAVSITWTPDEAGAKYLILASAEVRHGTTPGASVNVGIGIAVNSTTYSGTENTDWTRRMPPTQDLTDYLPVSCVLGYTAPGSPSSITTRILLSGGTTNPGTAYGRNFRLLIIKLGANDGVVNQASGVINTSSTTWTDVVSLTLTAPGSGDYLVIGIGESVTPNATSVVNSRLLDPGGSPHCVYRPNNKLSGAPLPFGGMKVMSVAAGSRTFKFQHRRESGTGTWDTRRTTLAALWLPDFDHATVAEDHADDAGTNTSFTRTNTLNVTGADTTGRVSLLLAMFGLNNSSTTLQVDAEITEEGTARHSISFEATNADREILGGLFMQSAQSGSSIEIGLDRRSETASATATMRWSTLAWLDLVTSTPFEETVGAGAVEITGAAPTLLAGTGQILGAGAGSIVATGYAPTLVTGTGQVLAAEPGSIEAAGAAPALVTGQVLEATAGSLVATGYPAGLVTGVLLTAAPGVVEVTGHPVTADISGSVELTAGVGEYLFAGAAAALVAGQVLAAAAGTIVATGHPATLLVGTGVVLEAAPAAIVVTGSAPTLVAGTGVILTATAGGYTWTGGAPAVVAGQRLQAGAGSVVATGGPADLVTGTGAILAAAAGAVGVTGGPAALVAGSGVLLQAGAGAIEATGGTTTLSIGSGIVLSTAPRAITFTGYPPTLDVVSGYTQTAAAGGITVAGGLPILVASAPFGPPYPAPGDLAALLADTGAEPRFIFEVAPYRTSLGAEQWLRFTSHPLTTGPNQLVPNCELVEALEDFSLSSNLWSSGDGGRGVILGESSSNNAGATLDNADGTLSYLFAVGPDGVREFHWGRRPARCMIGHPTWDYDDHVVIWTGHVDDAESGADQVNLRLYDVLQHLDDPIQERVYLGNRWDGVATSAMTPGLGAKTLTIDNRVTNGGFASNLSGWTAGTGWSQSAGKAVKTAGTSSNLAQDNLVTAADNLYRLRATLVRTTGTLQVMIDGAPLPDALFSASGTIDVLFTASGAATDLAFAADSAFAGSLDDVTVRQEPEAGVGDFPIAASEADMTTHWTWGNVTSWTPATGVLAFVVTEFGGSGSHSDWLLWLRPEEGGPDQAGKPVPDPWGIVRRVEPDLLGEIQGHLMYRGAEAVWLPLAGYKGGAGVPIAPAFPPGPLEAFAEPNRGIALVSTDVTAGLPVTFDCVAGSGPETSSRMWTQPGAVQFVVPGEVTQITFTVWGGAGAGNEGADGGGGGFVVATLDVTPGEALTIVVGGGGRIEAVLSSSGAGGSSLIAPGGRGGARQGSPSPSSGGGGASGVLRGTTRLLVAPGGGGAAEGKDGGVGGGADGGDGQQDDDEAGKGASASAGGDGGQLSAPPHNADEPGDPGTAAAGGDGGDDIGGGNNPGGGGGGGRFGGGGGAARWIDTNGAGPGGGGSALVPVGGETEAGSAREPGGTDSGHWDGVAGRGGTGAGLDAAGQPGRVVATWSRPVSADPPTAGALMRRVLRDRMGYRLVEVDQATLVSVAADGPTKTFMFGASVAALGFQPFDVFSLSGTSANSGINFTVLGTTSTTVTVREAVATMGADTAFGLVLGDVDGTALAALDPIGDLMGHVLRDAAETGRDVGDKILGSLGWFIDATPGGQVTFAPFGLPTDEPVAYLEEVDGGDILETPVREAATTSAWRVHAGAEECYRVHSASEIATSTTVTMRQFVATQWRENDPRLGTDQDVRIKDLKADILFVPTRFAYRASLTSRVPVWLSWFGPDREAWSFPVSPKVFGLRQGQTIAIRSTSAGINDWINVVIVGRDASRGAGGGRLIVWR